MFRCHIVWYWKQTLTGKKWWNVVSILWFSCNHFGATSGEIWPLLRYCIDGWSLISWKVDENRCVLLMAVDKVCHGQWVCHWLRFSVCPYFVCTAITKKKTDFVTLNFRKRPKYTLFTAKWNQTLCQNIGIFIHLVNPVQLSYFGGKRRTHGSLELMHHNVFYFLPTFSVPNFQMYSIQTQQLLVNRKNIQIYRWKINQVRRSPNSRPY